MKVGSQRAYEMVHLDFPTAPDVRRDAHPPGFQYWSYHTMHGCRICDHMASVVTSATGCSGGKGRYQDSRQLTHMEQPACTGCCSTGPHGIYRCVQLRPISHQQHACRYHQPSFPCLQRLVKRLAARWSHCPPCHTNCMGASCNQPFAKLSRPCFPYSGQFRIMQEFKHHR
jgi:hypothetical protein